MCKEKLEEKRNKTEIISFSQHNKARNVLFLQRYFNRREKCIIIKAVERRLEEKTVNRANSIKICINGVHYHINTTEPEQYVQGLAKELDDTVKEILEKNPSISFNDVMVLCAINYIDAYKRSEENADRMRSQLSEYLEDAAKARIELDEVKRENAQLRRQQSAKETRTPEKDVKS